jgi:hypothetical protein
MAAHTHTNNTNNTNNNVWDARMIASLVVVGCSVLCIIMLSDVPTVLRFSIAILN